MNGALNTPITSGATKTINRQNLSSDLNRLPDVQRIAEAECKYADAVNLYAATDMPLGKVAEACGVTAAGLSAHIGKYHRGLLYIRYGIDASDPAAATIKVKSPKGQSRKTHLKYKDAVEACGDIAYIEYNVSQVARMFGLNGSALAAQLRVHYPDIIPAREKMRRRLGIADNTHRGARLKSVSDYEKALKMYESSDLTIQEVAERCDVSKGGLVQFMRFYRKDVIASRASRREAAGGNEGFDRSGHLSGNGRPYGPRPETVILYAQALYLYRSTSKTIREIVAETGVPAEGFKAYLNQWHRADQQIRRGATWDGKVAPDLKNTPRYLKSTRSKYSRAILSLKTDPRPVSKVAAEFGLNPDVFREYLREHEPALAAGQGMTRLPDGKQVKKSSYEKYLPAIEEYSRSSESLRSIAMRHGLVYKSLMGYMRRNCPEKLDSRRKVTEADTVTAINNHQ